MRSRIPAPSELPLDVVIPCAEKDGGVLPCVIRGIRKNLLHPNPIIYIVAPRSQAIQQIARSFECVYVLEDDITPVARGSVKSGWMFQQFLKWSGGRVTRKARYPAIDADTVLIRPQVYARNGKL